MAQSGHSDYNVLFYLVCTISQTSQSRQNEIGHFSRYDLSQKGNVLNDSHSSKFYWSQYCCPVHIPMPESLSEQKLELKFCFRYLKVDYGK